MTPPTPEERELAIRLLTELAAAKTPDEVMERRRVLIDTFPMGSDPIGTPCPADDPDAGYGLTLGCPASRPYGGAPTHTNGHGWFRITARIEHVSRLARDSWKKKPGGAA